MTRITLWTLSTLSVLVLLFGYHTSTVGPTVASTPPAAYSGSIAGTTTTGTTGTTGSTGSTGGSTGSSTPSSTPTPDAVSGTFTGAAVDTQWGPVQVALVVADSTITDVQVPVYPSGNPKDAEINSYALPVLIQSTLDRQSADIDMVSGATVTSVGYQQSLQSALDQAGL